MMPSLDKKVICEDDNTLSSCISCGSLSHSFLLFFHTPPPPSKWPQHLAGSCARLHPYHAPSALSHASPTSNPHHSYADHTPHLPNNNHAYDSAQSLPIFKPKQPRATLTSTISSTTHGQSSFPTPQTSPQSARPSWGHSRN